MPRGQRRIPRGHPRAESRGHVDAGKRREGGNERLGFQTIAGVREGQGDGDRVGPEEGIDRQQIPREGSAAPGSPSVNRARTGTQ